MVDRIDILEVGRSERSDQLLCALLGVWHDSVRASHRFLTEADIQRIAPQAKEALQQIQTLWVVEDKLAPIGFMGIQGQKIEMLFLHPAYFRKRLGKRLVQRAFQELNVKFVDVNEQNPDATRFYERMGFQVFNRHEYDSEGNPFPILEMRR